MSDQTGIEWTDATWNPVVGCRKVSEGCRNCYAERDGSRLAAMGAAKVDQGEDPGRLRHYQAAFRDGRFTGRAVEVPEALDIPTRWKRPRRIFVNSMSDLFHEGVGVGFIAAVFARMLLCQRHTFQVLTKRPERMRWLLGQPDFEGMVRSAADHLVHDRPVKDLEAPWPLPNVWLGVSVENQAGGDERIPLLLKVPAAVRFLSMEPLLGPVDLGQIDPDEHDEFFGLSTEDGPLLDWVIVGGESGPAARPMHPDWVRAIRDECAEAQVPFLFKQWGEWGPPSCPPRPLGTRTPGEQPRWSAGSERSFLFGDGQIMDRVGKKAAGRTLDGRTHDEFPDAAVEVSV